MYLTQKNSHNNNGFDLISISAGALMIHWQQISFKPLEQHTKPCPMNKHAQHTIKMENPKTKTLMHSSMPLTLPYSSTSCLAQHSSNRMWVNYGLHPLQIWS